MIRFQRIFHSIFLCLIIFTISCCQIYSFNDNELNDNQETDSSNSVQLIYPTNDLQYRNPGPQNFFTAPSALSLDSNGKLYVFDQGQQRLYVYQTNFILESNNSAPLYSSAEYAEDFDISENGLFYFTVGKSNHILITENGLNITNSVFGEFGQNLWEFNNPSGISAFSDNLLLITETGNHRIQIIGFNGSKSRLWGHHGSGQGEFSSPGSAVFGPDSNIYVADTGNHRIQKFSFNGTFIKEWGGFGSGSNQFRFPQDLAVGTDGKVFVADTGNHRIMIFDREGLFLSLYGGKGSEKHQLINPESVMVHPNGTLWIADTGNRRIIQISPPVFTNLNISETISTNSYSGTNSQGQLTNFNLYLTNIITNKQIQTNKAFF